MAFYGLVLFAPDVRPDALPLGRPARLVAMSAMLAAACAPAPLVVTPEAQPPARPLATGERGDGSERGEAGGTAGDAARARQGCFAAGDAPCGGASATDCTEHALAAWSEARDDRALACVARMLGEACSLDDARGCTFAGRLWLDGRGVARDPRAGLDMLLRGCDGGVPTACAVAARWLAEGPNAREFDGKGQLVTRVEAQRTCLSGVGDACFQVGIFFYNGRDAFPRDRTKATAAFRRGCDLGDPRACNNLGDSLAYGEGTGRDVERAAESFAKACHLGEALGCANLGYMVEHGAGLPRDTARARTLYRDACTSGEIYACLHVDMLAAEDAGAPRDGAGALAHWRTACDRGGARAALACAFVGILYEDGPDGIARDEAKSLQAMTRACDLGERRACDWVKNHPDE